MVVVLALKRPLSLTGDVIKRENTTISVVFVIVLRVFQKCKCIVKYQIKELQVRGLSLLIKKKKKKKKRRHRNLTATRTMLVSLSLWFYLNRIYLIEIWCLLQLYVFYFKYVNIVMFCAGEKNHCVLAVF